MKDRQLSHPRLHLSHSSTLLFVLFCCLFECPISLCYPAGLAPDLFSSVFSIIFEKWRADWLIFQDIPLVREREGERDRRRGKEGIWGEEFSCSLTPILGFVLGAEACLNIPLRTQYAFPLHSENILKNSLYTKCPLTTDVHMERCILSCVKRKCKETTGRLRMGPYGLHWWALFPLIRNPCFMFVVNTVVDSSISMVNEHTTDWLFQTSELFP